LPPPGCAVRSALGTLPRVTPLLAGVLVFGTSAVILVMEILAGRLLAPYVGVTLETFTAIIGTVLAAIALGTWLGGRLADRVAPRRLLGPELALGGVAAALAVPMARLLGPTAASADPPTLVLLVVVTVFVPAALLSAVPPTVVKAVLADLGQTGSVVGRYSALGTAGAIAGTFLTGFVLVPLLPTPQILMGLAVGLAVAGLALWWWLARTRSALLTVPALLAGVWLGTALASPCETETSYYCVRVEQDVENPSGRTLWLDTLRHAYVDVEDPTELRFSYNRMLAAVADATSDGPIDVLHIGGGGFTMPRWLEATRPGSTGVVLELDPEIVGIAEQRLGWEQSPEVEVLVGDARLGIRQVDQSSADLAIGDAFGGIAVPWHLTTAEFVGQVAAALRPGGVYAANIIDGSEMAFLRAEAATFATAFDRVAVLSLPERFGRGGNFVVVGSDLPIPVDGIVAAGSRFDLDLRVVAGDELSQLIGEADVLTDAHAPVDQLLTPGR
jgi:spermidine synthase